MKFLAKIEFDLLRRFAKLGFCNAKFFNSVYAWKSEALERYL